MKRIIKKVKVVPVVNGLANAASDALATVSLSHTQTKKVVKELLVDGWPTRRRVMYFTLAYCFGNVEYLVFFGEDTALNRETITTLLYILVPIIGTYVFGAIWDDRNRRDTMMDYGTLGNGGAYDPNLPVGQGDE